VPVAAGKVEQLCSDDNGTLAFDTRATGFCFPELSLPILPSCTPLMPG
jgi:hypothetical protein